MRLLSKYILRRHALPLLFAFGACTGFLLVQQIARRLPELLGKGLPVRVFFEFFALTVPFLVAMSLTMSVLMAVLYTFNQLTGDREITAMGAGGVSLGEVLRPLLLGATGVAVISFLFSDQVVPRTNHRLAGLMMDIARTKPTFSLKEHTINEIRKERLYLWAAQIDEASYRLRDVAVFDLSDNDRKRIVYGDSGYLAFAPNQEDLHLTLYDGSIHEFDRSDTRVFQQVAYGRQLILVRDVGREFARRETREFRGDREMGTCQLDDVVRRARETAWISARRLEAASRNGLRAMVGLPAMLADTVTPPSSPNAYCRALARVTQWIAPAPLEAQEAVSDRPTPGAPYASAGAPTLDRVALRATLTDVPVMRDRLRNARIRAAVHLVELHKKYSIPAACVVLAFVAVPIALRFPRGGVGLVIGASFAIFSIYYVGLIAGESLANRLVISPFVAMWASNMLLTLLGALAYEWQRRRTLGPRRAPRAGAAFRAAS